MILAPDSPLAFIAAPWQVIFLAFLAVGLLAPQLLPRIGRALGRLLRTEMLRRLGMSSGVSTQRAASRPERAHSHTPAVTEILMPERPGATLRSHADRSIIPKSSPPRPARKSLSLWLTGTVVVAIAGAIFWLLLHSR